MRYNTIMCLASSEKGLNDAVAQVKAQMEKWIELSSGGGWTVHSFQLTSEVIGDRPLHIHTAAIVILFQKAVTDAL